MKLKINNFAKIGEADIIIDGITIIAGENNTGKSTIGKILFSLFNSTSGIEDKITKQRVKEIEDTCRLLLRNYSMHNSPRNAVMRNTSLLARKIASRIESELDGINEIEEENIRNIIMDVLNVFIPSEDIEKTELYDMLDTMFDKVLSIIALSEENITLEVLSRYFNSVFHDQINSLIENNLNAELELEIKGKTVGLIFSNNECVDFSANIAIMHNAIYIDNPFVIDTLSSYDDLNTMDDYLRELLTNNAKESIMEGIIESVIVKEKLSEVYQALQHVVDGQIIEKKENEFYLDKEGFSQPIYFNNLSTGIKSFVIIKLLLEKGSLKEKDVLILDEPEIHLHPQWQVAYAELVVLLQKYFDLSIVVATHSPYFLDAINLFSIKHGIDKKVNYYLSAIENNKVKMDIVTDNIESIYKKMASPIQVLDTLRYELNNN